MTDDIRVRMKIQGRVQGVFFRASALREARRLGLTGFARNESDGSVYIEIQGDESAVRTFLTWARQGPGAARVDDLTHEAIPPVSDETDFSVL